MGQNNLQNTVNSNEGITNIIGNDEIRTTMISTFIELANILKDHCGPYSGTAILTNPQNPMAEPVFTKDGINIISSIKYANVMQDFARMQLAYMGSRVERGAGDGTTSAMIIMAYAVANLLKYLKKSKYYYTLDDLTMVWDILVGRVEDMYNGYKQYTNDLKDPEAIRHIAASQAYTSSHGDRQLAECIGEMFANTPREVWDTLTVQKASYESEEKYRVDIKEAQYTIDDVTVFPVNRRNKEIECTTIEHANCLTRTFLTIGDDSQKFVHDYIEQCIKDGTQLIIFTCNDLDSNTINHYENLFSENPDHHVLFFLSRFEDGVLNDINAIDMIRAQMSGPLDMTQLNMFEADLELDGSTLRIKSGLFIENPYDSRQNPVYGLNPYYKSESYPIYNKYIEHIKQIISKEKSDITRKNTKVIDKFTRILHKLIATKDVTFTVGGAAYDNAAGQDIAMDALLAAKCSLTEGCVSGGFLTLREMLTKNTSYTYSGDCVAYGKKRADLLKAYKEAIVEGIAQVNKAIIDRLSPDAKKKIKGKEFSPFNVLRLDDPSYAVPESFIHARGNKNEYCVLQPAMTDITFMKRFGEVGLKFLTANRVITSGYYYVNKEK